MSAARNYLDFLHDMLDAMDAASAFIAGMEFDQFVADQRTVYAVTHALEVVGEATKRIPIEVRDRHAVVPWRLMAGMRDRLIHGYDTLDVAILWKTVTTDMVATRPLIAQVLEQERTS